MAEPHTGVLPLQEAVRAVEQNAVELQPTKPELIDLLQCGGRILAEPIAADRDFPPFPRAARDGYALRAADAQRIPAKLKITGEIRAGASPESAAQTLRKGEAIAIMTGAPAPGGADAVIMVEHTARDGEGVELHRSVSAGENIVPAGAEARAGEVLLQAGARLTPAAIGVAASVGRKQVRVYARPRVAVLSTGDEVVDVAAQPGPTQIRNSNSYSLAAQIRIAGGEPVLLPIAPDEPVQLKRLIHEGLASDLLLLSGGVSMGKYDLVEQILAELKAEIFFTGALIQPGRPVVFGRVPLATADARRTNVYFLGLPGNPVSTLVTFELFARPLIDALSGAPPRKLQFVNLPLKSEIRTKKGLTRFLPALLSGEFEQVEVERVSWQGSGDIAAAARANCFVVVPPDREHIPAGEMISVLLR
jgi:molybdopterin molybdotransferase